MRLSRLRRGQERYYLETVASGAEDHRAPGLEPDGVWLGRGARLLGLAGPVDGGALRAVLDGADPATGEKLSPTHGRVQVVGLDLTFAAPKQ
ncbi:MAG: relaxase domain-containing protein, partial [Acidimicrobiales bacterium]|nr:relaxase domain-containing protein [Acidimicrobiales bacterium]